MSCGLLAPQALEPHTDFESLDSLTGPGHSGEAILFHDFWPSCLCPGTQVLSHGALSSSPAQSSVVYWTALFGSCHPSNWTHPKAQHQFPGAEPRMVLTTVGRHYWSMAHFSPKWTNSQLRKWKLQDMKACGVDWKSLGEETRPCIVQYGSCQPHVAAEHLMSEVSCAVSIYIFRVSTKNRKRLVNFYIDSRLK